MAKKIATKKITKPLTVKRAPVTTVGTSKNPIIKVKKVKPTTLKDVKYAPKIYSKNSSIKPLRSNSKAEDEAQKHPLGVFDAAVLVNVGSRTEACLKEALAVINKGGVVLNHPDKIRNASNKIICKQRLIAEGIPTPKFILASALKNDDTKLTPLTFPLVAKKISGMGGEGMAKLDSLKDLMSWKKSKSEVELKKFFIEEVFQPDLKFNYEYRIGVSPLLTSLERTLSNGVVTRLGEVVVLRKKMLKEASEAGAFGRNIATGNAYFERLDKRTHTFTSTKESRKTNTVFNIEDGIDIARRACLACELDFAAVDMLFDSVTGNWTVLELNTAPSMGNIEDGPTFTLESWQAAFKVMISEKMKL